MDRKDLKIEALRQRITALTTQYEDTHADLRVELTLVMEERDSLLRELEGLRQNDEANAEDADSTDESNDVS